jgi:hydrogenase nickel incorporation protein HypA/HybF
MALTEKILNIIIHEAEAHHAKKIKKIEMVLGDLSGVVSDSMEMYFELISKGTMAEGATLEFTREKARLYCNQCQTEYIKEPGDFLCPICGNLGRFTDVGRECIVKNIEVE